MIPRRIQRRRSKGWRAPPGTLMCTRPGPWGNPFLVYDAQRIDGLGFGFRWLVGQTGPSGNPSIIAGFPGELPARDYAVYCHHCLLFRGIDDDQRRSLAEQLIQYHYLACWCPLDTKACHVENLIELCGWEIGGFGG